MSGILSMLKAVIRLVLPRRLRDWINFRRALRNTDVFLVGHPKSGNTWLAYMLAVMTRNDREQHINISNIGEYAPTIHGDDNRVWQFAQLPDPRIFRNEATVYPDSYPRTIYILRDPRAVLLSYYHHCVHDTQRADWPIGDFVDEMLAEGCIKSLEPDLIRWDRQVEAWLARSKRQNVILVKYEDLKNDCHAELEKLSRFLGLAHNEDAIALAVERGDFSQMRNEEKQFGAESYAGEKGQRGFFVRKGKVDSWKEEMPPEVIGNIEQAFYPTMKKTGYLE